MGRRQRPEWQSEERRQRAPKVPRPRPRQTPVEQTEPVVKVRQATGIGKVGQPPSGLQAIICLGSKGFWRGRSSQKESLLPQDEAEEQAFKQKEPCPRGKQRLPLGHEQRLFPSIVWHKSPEGQGGSEGCPHDICKGESQGAEHEPCGKSGSFKQKKLWQCSSLSQASPRARLWAEGGIAQTSCRQACPSAQEVSLEQEGAQSPEVP